jgi:hypothetical protein
MEGNNSLKILAALLLVKGEIASSRCPCFLAKIDHFHSKHYVLGGDAKNSSTGRKYQVLMRQTRFSRFRLVNLPNTSTTIQLYVQQVKGSTQGIL